MYRDASHDEPVEATGDVLLRLDASGRSGARGRDGLRGADGGGGGADGSPGGHAGPAEQGAAAGRVDVTLRDDGVGRVEIVGTRVSYDGRSESIETRREIGEAGFLDFVARGGAGGGGGRGGEGGSGARGRSGSDATRYSSGGNGGPGGDGGAGGRGTSGAAGGRGGVVQLHVRDEDSHLLMLVRHGVDGGPGGAPGAHGAGGAAGAGGAGGSGHSWTTTETYQDSQGHTHTRTHHHHNPGGSSGPSGRAGMPGSGPLHEGARGEDGSFTIELDGARGVERYASRYHLALGGLEVHTLDVDGVTEPGERVELRRVRVTNVGGMPTPRHHDTTLSVLLSNWARPIDGASLVVPRGLAAGQTVELEGVLPFELRDFVSMAEGDPLAEAEPITIDARVPDVRRSFEGFLVPALDRARTLLVRFPVALSVLEGLPSLAPDEMTRVRFAVRNQSRVSLGASTSARRRVRVRMHLFESELDDRHAVLFDDKGLPCLLGGDGLVRELDLLEPGQDAIFELSLGIRRDAPAYRALRVRLTLEIGRLDAPEELRVVQHRALEIRVAERVGRDPYEWLLVTHHKTTREEVDAWRALASRMGRALALYDLSLHGDLRLDQPFEGGPSLVSRARGGLVIVLGYPLDTPSGPRAPTTFLTDELLQAMGRERTDLLVLGGPGELADWARGGEPGLAPGVAPLRGTDALLETLTRTRREERAADAGLASRHRVEVFEVVWGFEAPSEPRLRARAEALAEHLSRAFPDREHEVVFELDPDLTPSWAPVRKRRLGWLEVRSRAAKRSGLAHLQIDDDALHAPSTLATETITQAVLLARGIDDRAAALAAHVAAGELEIARALADAVLVSIACEQLAVVRRTRSRAGLDHGGMVRALVALETIARTRVLGPEGLGAEGAGSDRAAIVVRIAARARFFARAQASLWERLWGLSWLRRAGALVSVTDDAIRRFLAVQSDDPDVARALEDRCRVELEVLEGAWRAAREQGQRDKAAFAKELLLAPAWSTRFTVDEELVLAHAPTAIAQSDWAAARAERIVREHASGSTEKALDALRGRLGLPESTEARLAEVLEEAESTSARSRAELRA